MVDQTSDLLENPLITGSEKQANNSNYDLASIQLQSPAPSSPLSLPSQPSYCSNHSSLPPAAYLPLKPAISFPPSTQDSTALPVPQSSSLRSTVEEELVLPLPPQVSPKPAESCSEQTTLDWWDYMGKPSTNPPSSTTHLYDNQREGDKAISSFLDMLDSEVSVTTAATVPPSTNSIDEDVDSLLHLDGGAESNNDFSSMLYADLDFLMKDDSKGSPEEESAANLQENQSQSSTMVELVSNINGIRTCKFASTATIQEVFQYFFSLRSGKPATKAQMDEYTIVDFKSPNQALPLDKTIEECNLVNKSHVESRK